MKLHSAVFSTLKKKVPNAFTEVVDMAYNTAWSWHSDVRKMFKYMDKTLWFKNRYNVVKLLHDITPERLEELEQDPKFEKRYLKALEAHQTYNHNNLWFKTTFPQHSDKTIAYLSMEYGIHVSVPIYSGGLGILSGDHLKESSDLGIPINAVGFLYQEGYFSQRIPEHGWQEAIFREYDFKDLPIFEVMDPKDENKQLVVPIDFNDIVVYLKVWLLKVGNVNLFLMDSNIDQNPPWDRDLTDRLYGGSSEQRLKQEMMLGLGAVRLFDRLNITPSVWHLNEGHCSFSAIERIRKEIRNGTSFDEALSKIRSNTVFTTHTPVPAGHDVFPLALVKTYFEKIYIQEIGEENFFKLGNYQMDPNHGAGFNMTALGMRTSKFFNAVAALHREVSQEMFEPLWSELQAKWGDDFVPLKHVTNGVHVPSFISVKAKNIFEKIDSNWLDHHDNPDYWAKDAAIWNKFTDKDIWDWHMTSKKDLVTLLRELTREKREQHEWSAEKAFSTGILFDPEALTIGFARRFATYKRATLIFTDLERIKRIVTNPYRPVQIVFAGKAHPADDPGKQFIQDVVRNTLNPEFQYRIAFIEDYDLVVAKRMLQGVDIWLNNPLRPNEASGTSGMKAAINFVPNLSILDGWWAEGYNGKNGWAINPDNREFTNPNSQNWHDAQSIYQLLEEEIIPKYYGNRDKNGVPVDFMKVMKEAMVSSMPNFSARRMLKQYCENLYTPLM